MLEPGEWLKVRNRRYRVVDRLSAGGDCVERYKAVDPDAKPGGDVCSVHVLPCGKQTLSYVRVLKRASERSRTFLPVLFFNTWHDRMGNRKVVLVLPWLAGRTLRAYLNASQSGRGPGISAFEAVRLFRGLAHGICHLNHHANIVHGDIKPENLVVSREPTQLVLIDFGSAWLVEETVKRGPLDGLTRAYAAPERISGVPSPDFRSDQFSVSAVMYEMLTFAKPYGGLGGSAADEGNAGYQEVPPPSTKCRVSGNLMDSVWKKIDTVTLTGLHLDRERRYRNRRDWLDAVDDIDFEIKRTSRLVDGDKLIAGLVERIDGAWNRVAALIRRFGGKR